jgi:dTDP-4-amino-4,6-dideoxygalactose transaminase
MPKPIHISLSPNTEADDVTLAWQWLRNSYDWFGYYHQMRLKSGLHQLFPKAEIYLLNAGRSALMLGLQALELEPEDEVITQAFTCSALINPLLHYGLKPVYADIRLADFNLDVTQLKQLVTKKTKAVIIQHTFGMPSQVKEVVKFCRHHKLWLIEDCAHALGMVYDQRPVGSFGDIALLSFGRDKVISSVYGGALVVNDQQVKRQASTWYTPLAYPEESWTRQQLRHVPVSALVKTSYGWQVGKLGLVAAQRLQFISKAIYPQERQHRMPEVFLKKLPEPLAALADHQLDKLEQFNRRRQQIAQLYEDHLSKLKVVKPAWVKRGIYLRYNVLTERAEALRGYLKKQGIVAGDWYRQPVTPSVDLTSAGYESASCPRVEQACRQSVNLPTYPTMSLTDAERVVDAVNRWEGEI